MKRRKRRGTSGTQWTEAQMAKRYDSLHLRLDKGFKVRLDALLDPGMSRADWVMGAIEAEEVERAERGEARPVLMREAEG